MSGKHKNPLYGLRIPQEMKDMLSNEAKLQNRSLNAEILARLSETIQQDKEIREHKKTSDPLRYGFGYILQWCDYTDRIMGDQIEDISRLKSTIEDLEDQNSLLDQKLGEVINEAPSTPEEIEKILERLEALESSQ